MRNSLFTIKRSLEAIRGFFVSKILTFVLHFEDKNLNISDQIIRIDDYNYSLPEEKIALHPLEKRDESKLLYYKNGEIQHTVFKNITQFLPTNSLLVFNETKVIYARLHAKRATGGQIEILLLDPISPASEMQQQLQSKSTCTWKCMIGNKKKWKEDEIISIKKEQFHLSLRWEDKEKNTVNISWKEDYTFAEILHHLGEIPIPPYLQREVEEQDKIVYQTVYSKNEGSVAAPTAGLHFTPEILQKLEENDIAKAFVTLHVGAGTFLPVKTENALEHEMHREFITISTATLEKIIQRNKIIIPVGTTSMRTLESVYWFGVGLIKQLLSEFQIPQYFPYQFEEDHLPTYEEAFQAVLNYANSTNSNDISGYTSIMIIPGYQFRVSKGIITNFHQPCSTLLLLISALVGKQWKVIYQEALNNNYRFLSFGDSSLLLTS